MDEGQMRDPMALQDHMHPAAHGDDPSLRAHP
jgi:hypothetical protein